MFLRFSLAQPSLFLFLLLLPAVSLVAQPRSIDQRVDDLLAQMTLEEKAGQLTQYSGRELTEPASPRKADLLNSIRSGAVGPRLRALL